MNIILISSTNHLWQRHEWESLRVRANASGNVVERASNLPMSSTDLCQLDVTWALGYRAYVSDACITLCEIILSTIHHPGHSSMTERGMP